MDAKALLKGYRQFYQKKRSKAMGFKNFIGLV
jgi:hypothetical protein